MKQRYIKAVLFKVFVMFITLIIVFPIIWMVILSFKNNTEIVNEPLKIPNSFSFENYRRALDNLNLIRMYFNTFIIAGVSEVIILVITYMSSFALSRMSFKSKKLRGNLYLFLLIGLAVPVYILLFPLYRINIVLNLLGTRWAVIFPYIATAVSFNTLLFVGFLNSVPKALEEAAIIDGCNIFQVSLKVVAPISKVVFATVSVFNILYIWNEYPFAITYLMDRSKYTISLSASLFKGLYSVDYSGIVAATVMIIIPQLIFYGSLQKYIIKGMTDGAVKG